MAEFIFDVNYKNSLEIDKQILKEFLKVRKFYLNLGYDFDCSYLDDFENFKNFDDFYSFKLSRLKNLYPNFPQLDRKSLSQDEINKLENRSKTPIQLLNKLGLGFQTSTFQLDGPEYPIVEDLFLNLIKLDGVDFIYANEGSLWDYFGFGYFFYCKSFDLFIDAVIYRTWGINLGSSPKLLNKLMEIFFSNNVFQEDGSIIYAPSSKNSNFWHLHNSYYNFYNENREELTKLCEEVPIQKPYGYYEDKK